MNESKGSRAKSFVLGLMFILAIALACCLVTVTIGEADSERIIFGGNARILFRPDAELCEMIAQQRNGKRVRIRLVFEVGDSEYEVAGYADAISISTDGYNGAMQWDWEPVPAEIEPTVEPTPRTIHYPPTQVPIRDYPLPVPNPTASPMAYPVYSLASMR